VFEKKRKKGLDIETLLRNGLLLQLLLLLGLESFRPLLGIQDSLQLRWSLEASVLRVLLVEVGVGLRLQLGGELFHYAFEEAVDRGLSGSLAVPDGDEVRVETDRKSNARKLII
jgi:hypothetical protein